MLHTARVIQAMQQEDKKSAPKRYFTSRIMDTEMVFAILSAEVSNDA